MNCWLTVHYPPELEAPVQEKVTGIWVPRERADKYPTLAVGDGVVIYETKAGPARWLTLPDGTRRRSRYLPGRGGVVALGKVTEVYRQPPITQAVQDDGTETEWAQLAAVELVATGGFLTLEQTNVAIGYHPRARMRGQGGTRRLSHRAYHAIVQQFESDGK